MPIKSLEAWCKAKGYQGGNVFMMLEDLNNLSVDTSSDPYKWGVREANRFEHGYNLASYPIPVNSWNDNQSTLEYLKGLHTTLDAIWNTSHDTCLDEDSAPSDRQF